MSIKAALHTENLSIGYKNALCSPVSLSADTGEVICVIGLNGTGKSTLLKSLCGVLTPLSGNVFIQEQNLRKINILKRSQLISFVPSRPEFAANLKVRELASMGRSPYTNIFDFKKAEDILIVNQALHDFNLIDMAERQLWQLSDGERQRAMICRAFVQQTPVIILDEPTAFLDYKMRTTLLADLQKLAANDKRCVIFSSHDVDLAIKISDKIWFFDDDKIIEYYADEFETSFLR